MTKDRKVELLETIRFAELGCWISVLVIPILYGVSGPAVSRDQAWIRTVMICLAWIGVLISMAWRYLRFGPRL